METVSTENWLRRDGSPSEGGVKSEYRPFRVDFIKQIDSPRGAKARSKE
jgi:hypothetical protein